MIDDIFANQGKENGGWLDASLAERIGETIPDFSVSSETADLHSRKVINEINSDQRQARRMEIEGVPFIELGHVGGSIRPFAYGGSVRLFEREINRLLKRRAGAVAGSASLFHLNPSGGAYKVRSGSMEPTLPIGTRVRLKKHRPFLGGIVVFHPPEGAQRLACGPKPHVVRTGGAACDSVLPKESRYRFIKRVVAGPGGEIYVRAGHVYRHTFPGWQGGVNTTAAAPGPSRTAGRCRR